MVDGTPRNGAPSEDGYYEAYVDDVLETYVGPPPDHCVFLVMRRTSGGKFAVKLTRRALDALERSLQAAREHVAGGGERLPPKGAA